MTAETSSHSTASVLRTEADSILHERGLLALMRAYGAPHVTGSYALDLMTWRDLDIYLESPDMPEERFFELGGRIALALRPSRMQFRNERIARTPGLPAGLYWGVYAAFPEQRLWKIDIWCVPSEECCRLLRDCNDIERRLTPGTRTAILQIKARCCEHPEYRYGFSSQDIYTAVLDDGIETFDQFRTHLQAKKGVRV